MQEIFLVRLIKFCYVTPLQKNDDRIQNPFIIKIVKVCCNRFKMLTRCCQQQSS